MASNQEIFEYLNMKSVVLMLRPEERTSKIQIPTPSPINHNKRKEKEKEENILVLVQT